jgi:hypothetical protein
MPGVWLSTSSADVARLPAFSERAAARAQAAYSAFQEGVFSSELKESGSTSVEGSQ